MCGIRDGHVKTRLLRESDMNLTKACDICRAAEATAVQMKSLSEDASNQQVHAVGKSSNRSSQFHTPPSQRQTSRRYTPKPKPRPTTTRTDKKCAQCGYSHSQTRKCQSLGKTCHKCGLLNHFSPVCRSKTQISGRGRPSQSSTVHALENDGLLH